MAPSLPDAAAEHYRHMQRLQAVTVSAGRRSWRRVDVDRISESWTEAAWDLLPVVSGAQTNAAAAGAGYSAMTLAQQGVYVPPAEFVNPRAFAGHAADGRGLSGLLYSPATTAKAAIAAGASPAAALESGRAALEKILATLVADAGRQAAGADIVQRAGVGYVRMLNPPSCSRCTILAGRFYRWNAGFMRHPNCFPAGVAVSGPRSDAATRRWYEGELVVLTTESGQNLPLTGNHPVLTSRGWIPANLLEEGDEVVRSTRPQGATPLVVPNHHQVPALIEDVWGALAVDGLDRVPSTAKDFHGDGQEGQVDVVRANRALDDGGQAALTEHLRQHPFTGGVVGARSLGEQCSPVLRDLRDSPHASCAVGSSSLPLSLVGRQPFVTGDASLLRTSALDAGLGEDASDGAARDAVLAGERELAGAGAVLLDDLSGGKVPDLARWDAPSGPLTLETADGYTSRGRDLLQRLAGQVELDRVIELRRTEFRGHVYSLTSSEGWHVANSLIVSNCDCVHAASTVGATQAARDEGLVDDPYEYFNSLPTAAELDEHHPDLTVRMRREAGIYSQEDIFTKAGAQAIRDGADISQVVNARRGMTANGNFTVEGTSRRGHAAQLLNRGQRRMTPEAIYEDSRRFGGRTDTERRQYALDRLREHGYILPEGQIAGGSLRGQREGFGQLGRGGTRRAASQAVLEARATGVRDPRNRYTMTAAERRLYDAQRRYETALSGISPYRSSPGFGQTPDPYGLGLNRTGAPVRRPVTPVELATAESEYRAFLVSGGQIFTRFDY